jgi:hypothetical protein
LPARVWAIADTHLGKAVGKTMDRFGDIWRNHGEKILANAWRTVAPDDVLLLPGDLSWATKVEDAAPDLDLLARLPGIKVCVKGNHDYWWESGKPLRYPGLYSPPLVLGNGELGIAGTRGWFVPEAGQENEKADRKILERERERLKASLAQISHCRVRLAMTHYPPHPYLSELQQAGVVCVTYGHLHLGSPPHDEALAHNGEPVGDIPFYCVAADRVNFTPRLIWCGDASPV